MEKIIGMHNKPHLCLFATTDITADQEILYFYGVQNQPWYAEVTILINLIKNLNKFMSILFYYMKETILPKCCHWIEILGDLHILLWYLC